MRCELKIASAVLRHFAVKALRRLLRRFLNLSDGWDRFGRRIR